MNAAKAVDFAGRDPRRQPDQSGDAVTDASQPVPAAIQRLARREKIGAIARNAGGSIVAGALTTPHRYLLVLSSQRKAVQAPVRLREITIPTGHGSDAQQTPQPLQGVPTAGLEGACACRWITCHSWFGPEAGTGICKGFKLVMTRSVRCRPLYGRTNGAR